MTLKLTTKANFWEVEESTDGPEEGFYEECASGRDFILVKTHFPDYLPIDYGKEPTQISSSFSLCVVLASKPCQTVQQTNKQKHGLCDDLYMKWLCELQLQVSVAMVHNYRREGGSRRSRPSFLETILLDPF